MFILWVLLITRHVFVCGYDSRKYFVTCDSFGECDIPITFPESNVSADTYSVIVNDDWINTTQMQAGSLHYLTQNIELTGDLPPRNIYMIYNIFNTLEKHFWRFNLTPLYIYSLRFGLSSIFIELRRPKTDEWQMDSVQNSMSQLMFTAETSPWISKKLKRQLTFEASMPILIEEKHISVVKHLISIEGLEANDLDDNVIDNVIDKIIQKLSELYGIPTENIKVIIVEDSSTNRRRLVSSLTLEYTIIVDDSSNTQTVLDKVNSLTGNEVIDVIAEAANIDVTEIRVIPQIAEQTIIVQKEQIITCQSKDTAWCISANYDKLKSNRQCRNNVCIPLDCCEKNPTDVNSVQFGNNTLTLGDNSVAMGVGLRAHDDMSLVIGHYNKRVLIDDHSNVFVVGNGFDESSRSNALEVDFDGNMHVSGSFTSNDISIVKVNDMLTSIESLLDKCKCSVGIFNCNDMDALKMRFNKIMSKLDSC